MNHFVVVVVVMNITVEVSEPFPSMKFLYLCHSEKLEVIVPQMPLYLFLIPPE